MGEEGASEDWRSVRQAMQGLDALEGFEFCAECNGWPARVLTLGTLERTTEYRMVSRQKAL